MSFHENLSAIRKSRGLSQDALAEKIQVSRQAVSKWECNDATPDLPKLLALSEALDISLDSLCGTGFSVADPVQKEEARHFSGKHIAIFISVVVLIAAVLFAGGFYLGMQFPTASYEVQDAPPALPDTFTVSGVNFSCDSSGYLSYVCTPSYIHPDLTYKITFTSSSYDPQTFPVTCEGGVCSGTLPRLKNTGVYSVTLVISNGMESRAVPIASGLSFTEGSVSWCPPQ